MKKLLITLFLGIIISNANALNLNTEVSLFTSNKQPFFKIGENRASFGIGFGWVHKGNFTNQTHFPSANFIIERSLVPFRLNQNGVKREIGFLSGGLQFGFHHGLQNNDYFNQSWTSYFLVPRISLYFHELFHEDDFSENIDIYGGIGLRLNFVSHHSTPAIVDNESGLKPGFNFHIGGRYYFSNHFSVFCEIGYGLSVLTAGISLRY